MMLSTDPISDMLARIRNALLVKAPSVSVPYSKVKLAVITVLKDTGWIDDVSIHGETARTIQVALKYEDNGKSVITTLRKVSTPGQRIYVGRENLPVVANNFGMAVISTSQGMMTNREARRRKLGGEIICEVL